MVIEELAKLGIHVRPNQGEQRTQCPQCSATRRKKRDRCLTVRLEDESACFHCWPNFPN